jgi:hypothetical protein
MWSPDGTEVIGLTASGRATVVALKLNNIFFGDRPVRMGFSRLASAQG